MKKVNFILILILLANVSFAQLTREEISTEAKEEALRRDGAGWKSKTGSLKLDLMKFFTKKYEEDGQGNPKYKTYVGSATGATYANAYSAAKALLKVSIAGDIMTDLKALVSTNLGNDQEAQNIATSVNQVIESSKQVIQQKVSFTELYTFYKEMNDVNQPAKIIVTVDVGGYSNFKDDLKPQIVSAENAIKEVVASKTNKQLLEEKTKKLENELKEIFK